MKKLYGQIKFNIQRMIDFIVRLIFEFLLKFCHLFYSLHYAVENNNIEMTKLLIEKNAELNSTASILNTRKHLILALAIQIVFKNRVGSFTYGCSITTYRFG
jgi:hypothetical protein